MNLALYSNLELNETEVITTRLFEVMGTASPTIGYISSAPDPRRAFYSKISSYYQHFGGNVAEYNDLEEGFDEHGITKLFNQDAIHISGGNTFRFLFWMRKRKLIPRLVDYARHGGALIGVSAGGILITPSIETAVLCGDSNQVGMEDLRGLGLVNFLFVPHAHEIENLGPKIEMLSKSSGLPVFAVQDDQGLIVSEAGIEIIGGAKYSSVNSTIYG